MDAFIGKKYKLDKSENFEEYMAHVGVSLVTRKLGNTLKPVMQLTKNGDVYTLHSHSTFKDASMSFKLGQEFDTETIDGRKVKTTITFEGNKMIEIQQGEKLTKFVREFSDAEVKAVTTSDHIVCTRIYKAC